MSRMSVLFVVKRQANTISPFLSSSYTPRTYYATAPSISQHSVRTFHRKISFCEELECFCAFWTPRGLTMHLGSHGEPST